MADKGEMSSLILLFAIIGIVTMNSCAIGQIRSIVVAQATAQAGNSRP